LPEANTSVRPVAAAIGRPIAKFRTEPRQSRKEHMTILSKLASRTVIVPVWFLVFALLVLSGSPMAPATGILLLLILLAAGMVLTAMLVLRTERPTIAPMPAPTLSQATLTSAGFVPNSWPDSGFRTSQQRGTRRD